MKRFYAGLHIKPSERADAILFKNRPPADSLSFVLKSIANATSPSEQARLRFYSTRCHGPTRTVLVQEDP